MRVFVFWVFVFVIVVGCEREREREVRGKKEIVRAHLSPYRRLLRFFAETYEQMLRCAELQVCVGG